MVTPLRSLDRALFALESLVFVFAKFVLIPVGELTFSFRNHVEISLCLIGAGSRLRQCLPLVWALVIAWRACTFDFVSAVRRIWSGHTPCGANPVPGAVGDRSRGAFLAT